MRSRAALVTIGILLLLAGAAVALSSWRAARERRAVEELRQKLEEQGGDATEHNWLGLRLAEQGSPDDALAHLEIAARRAPRDLRFGNDLRRWYVRFQQYDRNIEFFSQLAEANGDLPEPRLQLALAYIDKMPDHMLGIVGQGKLSKQSIGELTRILAQGSSRPGDDVLWSTLYALGMNHLYWPRALGHAPAAIDAFRKCLELQETGPPADRAYGILPWIGLGDAYVKDGKIDQARRVWKEAEERFGSDERLVERLSIGDEAALSDFVGKIRGLGIVIDTDLAILWGRAP